MNNFTAVANELIDSGELNPYQGWILVRIARRRVCFESQRKIAEGTNISLTQVNRTIKWLHENGYIERKKDGVTGRIGWSVVIHEEQMQQNFVPPQEHAVPPQEHAVPPQEHAVPPQERHLNKTTIKRNTNKNKEKYIYKHPDPEPIQEITSNLSLICRETLAPGFNEDKYETASYELLKRGVSADEINKFAAWWKGNGWHDEVPVIKNVLDHWDDFKAGKCLKRKPSKNGQHKETAGERYARLFPSDTIKR